MPLFWVAPGFLVPFWAIPGFLGIIFWLFSDFWVSFFGYSRIFGCHVSVKFNPDFGELILIFQSMTLWNVACRALVSYFLCRKEWQ